jgi:AcrR family transcriptional regulator
MKYTINFAVARSRREDYTEATRRALLDSAAEAFVDRGFADASLDEIARAARLTKGALYHHFAGKQDLFRAVFEEVEAEMIEAIRLAGAHESDPWRRLLAGIGAFLDACLMPRYRRIALEEGPTALGWDLWRQIDEHYSLALVRAPLAHLMRVGVLRPQPLDLMARVLLAALIEAGMAVAAAPDRPAARREAEALLVELLTGFRVDATR